MLQRGTTSIYENALLNQESLPPLDIANCFMIGFYRHPSPTSNWPDDWNGYGALGKCPPK